MLKFLRRYTKHLLVGVTILILVSWLLGSTLTEMLAPDESNEVIARAFGETIDLQRFRQAQSRAEILNRIGLAWQKPWLRDPQEAAYDRLDALEPTDWLLLAEEARRNQVRITPTQLAEFKTQIGLTPARLAALKNNYYLSTEQIDDILSEFLAVREFGDQNIGMPQCSTPEIKLLVRDMNERVKGRALVISAESLVDAEAPVGEDEIREMFGKYKDRFAGEGEDGFGYKWSARVRVEYLTLRAADVAPIVTITDREAMDFWTENKSDPMFRRPAETADESAETPTPLSPFFETFAEAKAVAVDHLRREKARREAESALSRLTIDLSEGWDHRNPDPQGYPKPPAGIESADHYDKIIGVFSRKMPRIGPLLSKQRSDLCTAEQLAALEGIGSSTFRLGSGQTISFATLAMNVQGLVDPPQDADSTVRSLYPALYQTPERVLLDAEGNAYVFRVVEAVLPAVPASVDEVREKVIADIRLKRAYDEAGRLAQALAERARTSSLDEAWAADTELAARLGADAKLQDVAPTPRIWQPGFTAIVLGMQDESLMSEIFALAQDWQPEGQTTVGALAAPRQRKWVVMQVEEMQRVTEDVYERSREQIRNMVLVQRYSAARADWYDRNNIRQRTGFVEIDQKQAAS